MLLATPMQQLAKPQTVASAPEIPRSERWAASFFLLCALALRCFYIFRFRYDNDEPQHLHTTWGWTQGLIQYRDFFDNHTPIFHLLFSPLVALIGERSDILTYMRFAMVPLWLVCLWAVWKIGCEVYSRRAGLWSAVGISLLSWWFFPALEYRTDNLWAPLWLCALAVLITGKPGWKTWFTGGLLLGLAAGVSMKTTLILAMAALAAGIAPHIAARRLDAAVLKTQLKAALVIAAGVVVVPAILCAAFAAKGCWHEFYYGVIQHNMMLSVDKNAHPMSDRLAFPIALPFFLVGAALIGRGATPRAVRQATLFLFAGFYYTALMSFWALITRQDYLPFYPVAVLVVVPWILYGAARLGSRATPWVMGTVGVIEIALILGGRPPGINGTLFEREILREVLQLTRPGEYVMDFKGEAVFRQRAFYYVIEPLTYNRMSRKLIKDTIKEDLVAKNVHVVLNRKQSYLKDTVDFLTENYLTIGQVRVSGRILSVGKTAPGALFTFPVAVGGSYVLWSKRLPVHGLLDGQPFDGPRELAPGTHTFQAEGAYPCLALLWDRAAAAGYKPIINWHGWQYEK